LSWGSAIEVPGTAALNVGRYAEVRSVSCSSAGECAAGGLYAVDYGPVPNAFLVSEKGGVWGAAIEVPGLAALGTGVGWVNSVSCTSAGNCVAGGSYRDASDHIRPFVVDERNGDWGTAIEVPGLGAWDGGDVAAVSCVSPGNCTATGYTGINFVGNNTFVVSEQNGTWGSAVVLADKPANADYATVSCGGVGDCVVAFNDLVGSRGQPRAYLTVERHGTWGDRTTVPGLAALSVGGGSFLGAVSCSSPGNCVAGGEYAHGERYYPFVAEEKDGKWGKAITVRGTTLRKFADVGSVSCASAGNCTVGITEGGYDRHNNLHASAYLVSETNGRWGRAIKVPGTAALTGDGHFAAVHSVSCASAGNCAATGVYRGGVYGDLHAFVVAERNGVWDTAEDVPGMSAFGHVTAVLLSCASAGSCAIGGSYVDAGLQAFVTSP